MYLLPPPRVVSGEGVSDRVLLSPEPMHPPRAAHQQNATLEPSTRVFLTTFDVDGVSNQHEVRVISRSEQRMQRLRERIEKTVVSGKKGYIHLGSEKP